MRVAITGATGIVGQFVARRLLAEGVAVRALSRAPTPHAAFASIEWLAGDLQDAGVVERLVDGVDAVVHCAYQHEPGRYRGGEGDNRCSYWRANLLAGIELMERARRAAVSRLVLISSRAVFGRNSPAPDSVGDNDCPVPDSFYGALKLALEAHASAFSASDGVCYASLRSTGVYGLVDPLENSKWFDIASAVLHGRPLPPARLATEVHGSDLAAAVWLLLQAADEDIAGRAFNCSDLLIDTRDVMASLATCLNAPVDLPPAAQRTPRHALRAQALQALGWRPGGEALLRQVLEDLAAAVSAGDAPGPPAAEDGQQAVAARDGKGVDARLGRASVVPRQADVLAAQGSLPEPPSAASLRRPAPSSDPP